MPEEKLPLKVFLSHAHSDADAVRALYDRLTSDGVDAWLDKEKLLPGQDWELEIRKAVREADVVVVCLSKQFNQAGYRQKEVRWALDAAMEQPEGEIFIIPARLEECDTLESLRKWHWVDLFESHGYTHLSRALKARAEQIGATIQAQKSEGLEPAKIDTVDRLSTLHSISATINTINSIADLRIVLKEALRNIALHLEVDAIDLLLRNSSSQELALVLQHGFFTEENEIVSFPSRGKIAKSAALEERIIQIADLSSEIDEYKQNELMQREKFVTYLAVPLVAKGVTVGVLEIFHRSPLNLDDAKMSYLEILAGQVALAIDSAATFEEQQRANHEATMAYETTLEGWSRALELRDQELQGHTTRVVELTLLFVRTLGLETVDWLDIRRGALLHDIGKMGIPDEILHKKPEDLTENERMVLQQHPQNAYDMLAPIPYLRSSLDIPYCHHEKWDGTGYPRRLKGEQIPLSARIFAVVDVYDSLVSDKPYQKGWPKEKALAYIQEQKGKHFDPRIIDAFLDLMKS